MAISKKEREKILAEKAADFKESTDNLLAELNAGINEEKPATTAAENTPPATGKAIKKQVVSYRMDIDKPLHKELKQIALDEESDIKSLIMEGLKTVLKKRGKNINDYL